MLTLLALLMPAMAQTTTPPTGPTVASPDLNAQYFRPSLDSTRTFWVDESQVAEQLFAPKLLLHYTNRPLVYAPDVGDDIPIVGGVAQADLMMSASYDRFRLGVDVPIYLVADGIAASGETGLGDLSIDGKARLSDTEWPVGLALSGRVYLPTATVDNALGSPNTGWEVSTILDKRFLDDKALVAANVGIRGGPRQDLETITVDDYLTWRAGAAYDLKDWVALSGELVGGYNLAGGDERAVPLEAMLGAHVLSDDVNIRIGGGAGLTPGIGAPDYRVVLGIDFPLVDPDPDTDGDGLTDSMDDCPNEPEDIDTVLDDDGCPDLPTPLTVEVVDARGRPIEGASVERPEGDLEPGTYTVKVSAEGYHPKEASFDVAPAEAAKTVTVPLELVMGTLSVTVKDTDGQPIEASIRMRGKELARAADWSGDVVPGKGPLVAEAQGYKLVRQMLDIEAGGETTVALVLEPSKADLVGDRIDIRDSVYFDSGKASIQERSHELLDEVAGLLEGHPEITRMRIEGHTDSRGSASFNKTLSQERADSVRQYLMDKGVDGARLVAIGYGEDKPLDEAKTAAAYEKNRRVDFFVDERTD